MDIRGNDARSQLTTTPPPALSTSRPACLSFKFSLPRDGDRSLRVSLVDVANSERPLWRVFRTRSSELQFETGQIPIVSGSAFRVSVGLATRRIIEPQKMLSIHVILSLTQ
ncbi:uncharacterized protein LOC143301128 [Babylonia areolata]|uniref:uncharacterized protein LOC143301128 n=1 Tax=Babylonia areolata TaxID=304850 RepID=UPI003FD3C598